MTNETSKLDEIIEALHAIRFGEVVDSESAARHSGYFGAARLELAALRQRFADLEGSGGAADEIDSELPRLDDLSDLMEATTVPRPIRLPNEHWCRFAEALVDAYPALRRTLRSQRDEAERLRLRIIELETNAEVEAICGGAAHDARTQGWNEAIEEVARYHDGHARACRDYERLERAEKNPNPDAAADHRCEAERHERCAVDIRKYRRVEAALSGAGAPPGREQEEEALTKAGDGLHKANERMREALQTIKWYMESGSPEDVCGEVDDALREADAACAPVVAAAPQPTGGLARAVREFLMESTPAELREAMGDEAFEAAAQHGKAAADRALSAVQASVPSSFPAPAELPEWLTVQLRYARGCPLDFVYEIKATCGQWDALHRKLLVVPSPAPSERPASGESDDELCKHGSLVCEPCAYDRGCVASAELLKEAERVLGEAVRQCESRSLDCQRPACIAAKALLFRLRAPSAVLADADETYEKRFQINVECARKAGLTDEAAMETARKVTRPRVSQVRDSTWKERSDVE